MKLGLVISLIIVGLGSTEAFSWWWMHPKAADLNEPVLVYRPGLGQRAAAGPVGIPNPVALDASPSPEITPLPEVYAKSAPMLRCSSGQVSHLKLSETSGIHLAFFQWDGTDTGSVLEAFRHMPEACLGSIGMTLLSKESPIFYQVGDLTLSFDHTVLRDSGQGGGPASPLVHSYRAVWVAGLTEADPRKGLDGNRFSELRTIRIKSVLQRFRPAHARVIQGAVRGISDPALAWQAFQAAMLDDLRFE